MHLSTDPLKLLHQLVQIPTVTGNTAATKEALDAIQDFLQQRGMHLYRDQHDSFEFIVATTRPTKQPTVMFVGHIDVVPAKDELFTVREVGDKLLGRGTFDMKGAIASYLLLVDRLQEDLSNYDFGIMIVSDEETSDTTVPELVHNRDFRPKAAVVLDGGRDWQLEATAKGTWFGTVTVEGKNSHGSRPWEGDSASFKLLALLDEIKQLFPNPDLDTNTLNISTLQAGKTGEAINQIPAKAIAGLDMRFVSKAEEQRIMEALAQICHKYNARLEQIAHFPVLHHDLTSPYLHEFAASIHRITGTESKGMISCAASDAAHFAALDIPCVVTYPRGAMHHSAEEWLDKQAYFDLLPILLDYTQKIAHVQTGVVARQATLR